MNGCISCLEYGYRGRIAPIVMLPKEFAGTIIKITKQGIKIVPAIPDRVFRARGVTSSQRGDGKAGPREGLNSLHIPLSHVCGHPGSTFLANDGEGDKPAGLPLAKRHRVQPLCSHSSRRGPAKKKTGG